jgi:Flp pilus assembly pilin Flp
MLNRTWNLLSGLARDEEGASLIEYVLLAMLVGVAALTGLHALGDAASNRTNNTTSIFTVSGSSPAG